MRVACEVWEGTLPGDYADEVPATFAECGRCGNQTESYGTSQASERRCLILLRETCPKDESNYYE